MVIYPYGIECTVTLLCSNQHFKQVTKPAIPNQTTLPPLHLYSPGKFELKFRYLIFQIISVIDGWGIPCNFALIWLLLDLTDDKSTLVQVMAWCRQATSHYLSQCWPRSLSLYGVTRPQRVNAWRQGCIKKHKFIVDLHMLVRSMGPTNDDSAVNLFQVMPWHSADKAASHDYLIQWWPRFEMPSVVIHRPQWVNPWMVLKL